MMDCFDNLKHRILNLMFYQRSFIPQSKRCLIDSQRPRRQRLFLLSCKNVNPANSTIESLPDELLVEILVRLSADDIYDNARLACRRWRSLIHTNAFVREHLHRTSSGLLLVPFSESHRAYPPIFVSATKQGRVQISNLSCRSRLPIMCSSDGLVLSSREDRPARAHSLFIFNPATKCAFHIPMLSIREPVLERSGIAYAAASMAYKVAGSYSESGLVHCGILTVGVDNACRNVAVEGLSPEARWSLRSRPLMTPGFLHWGSDTRVVSLNVETEIFTETPFPAGVRYNLNCCHLSTGEYLSLFVPRAGWSWEVWEMKPETWEWRKLLPKLDLEAHYCLNVGVYCLLATLI